MRLFPCEQSQSSSTSVNCLNKSDYCVLGAMGLVIIGLGIMGFCGVTNDDHKARAIGGMSLGLASSFSIMLGVFAYRNSNVDVGRWCIKETYDDDGRIHSSPDDPINRPTPELQMMVEQNLADEYKPNTARFTPLLKDIEETNRETTLSINRPQPKQ